MAKKHKEDGFSLKSIHLHTQRKFHSEFVDLFMYIYVALSSLAVVAKISEQDSGVCVCLQSLLSTYYCMSWQQDKWQPLLNTVASVQKYRWLKHSVQGAFSQSSLMATIVDFALKEEPLDVEKMRKCLLKQVGVGVCDNVLKQSI